MKTPPTQPCRTLADSRGIEPHPNNSSEPISSRTQQPCWITVQKEGNKTAIEHAQRATRTHAPTATRKHTPQRHQPQGYTPNVGHNTRIRALVLNRFASPSTSRGTRTRTPNRAPAFEAGVSTIPPHWQKKRGAETNTSNNHATTVRPTSGTNAHQPHHRPAQPACADTLNRPTQTGPTYSPTPRASWRKHPSATRTHPAHHQCRHTPQRDSTRSREHPRVVSAPRSA